MQRNPTLQLLISKSATALLAASLAFVVGCSPPQQTKESEQRMVLGIVFDSGGRGDKSFNDSAYAGAERARLELGAEIRSVESRSEKDYSVNLAAMAERGASLVVAVGMAQKPALMEVAAKYPETKFAIVDAEVQAPNIRSLVFSEEQGSFLAGYLAGLVSKTGRIGFVGGKAIPLIRKFEAGYVAGAKTARPGITVLPAKYTESWDDVSLGKQAAAVLFGAGADIVYHAAGRSGLGVIGAAEEAGKFAIGVDSNQDGIAEGTVLTSMLKRVDEAVFATAQDVKNDQFTPGTVRYDLKANGVGLTDMEFTRDKIGADNLAKLDKIRRDIVEGKIVVPDTPESLEEYLTSLRN